MSAPEAGLVIIELSRLGGDPDAARIMGERFHSELGHSAALSFSARRQSIRRDLHELVAAANRYLARGDDPRAQAR